MERSDLSEKQQEIIDFIHRFWDEHGYPPTVRDIVAQCGISSTSVVAYNLRILEKKGYIDRHAGVSRGIKIVDRARSADTITVPIIGLIAAGQPIPVPAADTWDTVASAETIGVTRDLTRGQEGVYALKVKGQSMIDALINDGDIVLMRYASVVENGEMAAVWLKDTKEATLKKVYYEPDRPGPSASLLRLPSTSLGTGRSGQVGTGPESGRGRIRLQPANTQMEPIFARLEDVEIQGKVIAVIRQL